jgi:isoquinoline 1-oxidoreductase beta subunit
MSNGPHLDRRAFLASVAAAGGALMLGFDISAGTASPSASEATEINVWIRIEPDDTVVIRVAKSEMGQGSLTALPMLVAEELECDWSRVRPEPVEPHESFRRKRAWGDLSTGASRSVRSSQQALRRAGAMAREMLIAAAAAQWNVAVAECRAAQSRITHLPTKRSLRFGQVAAAAAGMPVPDVIVLKPPGEWRLLGTRRPRLDLHDKVRGEPIYGIDVRVPGMLYAAVAQAPVFNGKLKWIDESALAGMRGIVKVVRLDDAVAVVADNWWRARQALGALPIGWDDAGNGATGSPAIERLLRGGLAAEDAGTGRRDGDVEAGLEQARRHIAADYAVPFLAHATMEPQNATVHVVRDPVAGDRVEVWAPTQNGEATLLTAARAAGVPPGNVLVHGRMMGGGFGRRGVHQDVVALAVKIARHVEAPVKVLWSREEDFGHDFYRPAAMARMSAGLDADGLPLAWRVRLTGPSILGISRPGHVDRHFQEGFLEEMAYDVPSYQVDYAMRATHVPVGFWRCVNHTQNCFFKESFVDELAHAAGQDPYLYRRRLLRRHPSAARLAAVLDAAAQRSGWAAPAPPGRFRGIALHEVHGTFTAAVIEVAVDPELRVVRAVSAIDCGHVVNPLTVETQVEGATLDALSAALYGEITIGEGRVQQCNFDEYQMLRMAQAPRIETVMLTGGTGWGGVGEPPVAVVAPALCNAVFKATGKRIRSLPLKNHDLRNA